MNESSLLLNGQVVNEGQVKNLDIFIKKGRIERIDTDLSHLKADSVMALDGKIVMPGMIDDQVHFREPGLTHKATIATESRAAVAGGITSFMDMPNCNPNTTDQAAINAKHAIAADTSWANYAFYLGATPDNLAAIKAIDPKSVCGVKVFMGASTGSLLVNDPKALERIFQHSPVLIATHCEDSPMIEANEAKFRAEFGDYIGFEQHPNIRSREACWKSSQFAVGLARQYGARLHVLHITTAEELALFEQGSVQDKLITAEACVHHLFFSDQDYAQCQGRIKCNPAIKATSDREALLGAVRADVIDIIATDHAPHTLAEKSQVYWQSPAGLPLVQEALLSLLEHVHRGDLNLPQLVNKVSHAVADRFDIVARGYLREGYWADLVVIDPKAPHVSQDQHMHYLCGWTPFSGYSFQSSIVSTFVNGRLVYHQGAFSKGERQAMPLVFDR